MNTFGRMAVAMVVVGGVVAPASATMPPNSYLRKTANTVREILAQIDQHPEVRSRYERHFGMTKPELAVYLSDLKLTKVDTSGRYLVYNVPADTGELRAKLLYLRKGTKIWKNSQGATILQWICGNPMTRGPKVVAAVEDFRDVTDPALAAEPAVADMVDEKGVAPEVANIETVAVAPTLPMNPTETVVTTPTFSDIVVEPVQAPSTISPSVPRMASGSFDLGRALASGIFGGVIFYVAGTKGEKAVNTGGGGGPVNPVPEPATMLAVGTGVSFLVARRRKSK